MKNKICSILLFGLFFQAYSVSEAQTPLTQTIRGLVTDTDSDVPLTGANVYVTTTNPILGSATDSLGYYEIKNVPIGRHSLKCQYIGYYDASIDQIIIGSAKEKLINIKLKESVFVHQEITVVAETDKSEPINDMILTNARSFTIDETNRYAATISDPSRMVKNYAGVAASGEDILNEFVIRGNSPKLMSWQVEGVEILNPNHLSDEGMNGGAINIISNYVMANSDFLMGAWPAEYGNALSGIFDIKLRNGNNRTHEYSAQIGVMGVDFSAEGPFHKNSNASFLFNYRYSMLTVLKSLGIEITKEDEDTKWQDFSYKLYFPTSTYGIISLWGVMGISSNNRELKIDSLNINSETMYYASSTGHKFEVNTGVYGLTHQYFFSTKSYIKTNIAISNKTENEYILNDIGYFDSYNTRVRNWDEKYNKWLTHVSSTYNIKISDKHTFRTGLRFVRRNVDLYRGVYNRNTSQREIDIKGDGNIDLLQQYVESKYNLNQFISLNSGLHFAYLFFNKNYTIEPRFALSYHFLPKHKISIGYGLHSQLQPVIFYFMDFDKYNLNGYSNRNLDFTKAHHFVGSYDVSLSKNLRMKLELYYQKLFSVPVANKSFSELNHDTYTQMFVDSYSSLSNVNTDDFIFIPLANQGKGENYGMEFTLEKFLSENWYFLNTISLYESKQVALDNIKRNTRYNGNYIFNLVAGKEFNVNSKQRFGINIRYTHAGGQRYIPLIPDGMGGYRLDYANSYSKKYKDYMRWDLSINYRFDMKKISHILKFEFQNIFDHDNIWQVESINYESGTYNFKSQFGFIPNFSYRIEF